MLTGFHPVQLGWLGRSESGLGSFQTPPLSHVGTFDPSKQVQRSARLIVSKQGRLPCADSLQNQTMT